MDAPGAMIGPLCAPKPGAALVGLLAAGMPLAGLDMAVDAEVALWFVTLRAVGTSCIAEGDWAPLLAVAVGGDTVVCLVTMEVSMLGEPAGVMALLEGMVFFQDVAVASHVSVLESSKAGSRELLVALMGVSGVTWGLCGPRELLETAEEGVVTIPREASLVPTAGPLTLTLGVMEGATTAGPVRLALGVMDATTVGVAEDATTARLLFWNTKGDTLTSGSAVLRLRAGDGAVTDARDVGGRWLPTADGDTGVALLTPGSAPLAMGVVAEEVFISPVT